MWKCGFFKQLGFAALLSLVFTMSAPAQSSSSGQIKGVVNNSAGAAMANATVVLQNLDNGSKQQATSDAMGNYTFNNVAPGRYTMMTTQNNVTSSPSAEVDVMPATVSVVNLTIGAPSRTVATTSPVTAVEQASGVQDLVGPKIENGWNTRYIEYLPASSFLSKNGQFFGPYNLSLLSAGVASNGGIGPAIGPVVGGQAPFANNYYLAGIDNTNIGPIGPLANISNEETSEFVAFQNQFPPEYGHASGGQFDAFPRTGTNKIHGALFDYFQNNNLDANDEIFTREGFSGDPHYVQNHAGGNAGGPIWQDKAFWFVDFEYLPLSAYTAPVTPVYSPTAAGYSTLGGLTGISAANLGLLRGLLPAASTPSAFTTVNGTSIPVGVSPLLGKAYQDQYNGVGAFDFKFRGSDTLLGRFAIDDLLANNNGASIPAFWNPTHDRSISSSLDEVHDFSGGAINELRLGYTRFDAYATPSNFSYAGLTGATGFGTSLLGTTLPSISIEGLNAELGQGLLGPSYAALSTFDLADNVHWTIGHQTIRLGADARRMIGPETFSQFAAGSYVYSSLGGFLSNLPPDASGFRTLGSPTFQTNEWDPYGYVKDEIRLTGNLEVDLGLRYEFVSLPAYLRTQSAYSYANVPGALTFGVPGTQRTGFAPTVGIAYSPGIVKNSVIRAGFGMNYDAGVYGELAPLFAESNRALYTTGLANTTGFFGATSPFFNSAYGTGLSPQAGITSYTPDLKLPYTMQWNVEWQQAISRFVLTVRYLGVRGEHLPAAGILNAGVSPVSATNGLPLFYSTPSTATLNSLTTTLSGLQATAAASNPLAAAGFTSPILQPTTEAQSWYNGLAVQGSQRFSGGFQFIAAYTWSHAENNITQPLIAADPSLSYFNQLTSWGNSLYDHAQRATMTWLWDVGAAFGDHGGIGHDIFGNFTFSGTYTYETAAPLPVVSGYGAGFGSALASSGVLVNPSGFAGTASGVTPLTNSFGQTVAYLANNPNAQYIAGAPGLYTNGARYTAPDLRPINNFDLSMVKGFGIHDKFNFEIRGDAYNVFNHAQFTTGPLNNIGFAGLSQSFTYLNASALAFGSPANVLSNNPRTLQVSLRLVF